MTCLALAILVDEAMDLPEVGEVLLSEAVLGELSPRRFDLLYRDVRVVEGGEVEALKSGSVFSSS